MVSLADKLSTRRLLEPELDPVVLDRRRIYILPTRHGYLFAFILLLMLIGSINYNNSLGFALTFMMGSLTLVSMIHTHRNLSGLQIRCGISQAVFAGDIAEFPLILTNTQGKVRDAICLQSDGSEPVSADIPPAKRITISLARQSMKRGKLVLGRVKIFTEYPLGLMYAWSWIAPDMDCIVYPPAEENAPPPAFQNAIQGEFDHSSNGQDDFSGLRQYRAGDSLKHIAWKQSSHGNEVFTKQFAGGGAASLWLEWEQAGTSNLEHRLSRLCRWVLDCENSGISYGLRLPGKNIPPDHGEDHKHQCLTALALYGQ